MPGAPAEGPRHDADANVHERLDALQRAEAVRASLTAVVLSGGGIPGLADELAELTGLGVEIEDATGTVLASVPAPPTAPTEQVTWPVVAAGEQLGLLRALGASASTVRGLPLDQACTVIALELQRLRGIEEAEARLHGELFEELLELDGPPSEELEMRGRRAGVELSETRRVVAMQLPDGTDPEYVLRLARSVPQRPKGALLARRGQLLVGTVAQDQADAAEAVVRALQARAERAGIITRAGISDSQANVRAAFQEATAALRLAQAGDASAIVTADRLGPLRFMLDARGTEGMDALVRRNLLALSAYDRESSRSDLLGTLRAFVQAEGRHRLAAEATHIHLNTLKYRLARIEDITGRSTADPDVRFELRLAFGVLDVLDHLGCPALEVAGSSSVLVASPLRTHEARGTSNVNPVPDEVRRRGLSPG